MLPCLACPQSLGAHAHVTSRDGVPRAHDAKLTRCAPSASAARAPQERFEAAAAKVKSGAVKGSPTDAEKLKVYALFKQATEGDVTGDRPGGLLNFEAKAKFDARKAIEGKSKDAAMEEYIAEVEAQIAKYSA